MQRLSKVIVVITICLIIIMMPLSKASAEENKYDSTVQINYGYLFEDGSLDVFCSAPAVIINSDTLITYDITTLDYTQQIQEKAAGYNTVGINTENIKDGFVFEIYKGDGNYIPVTEFKTVETEAGNILIIKSAEKLDNIANFSPRSGMNDDTIFATGFPAEDMDGSHFINKDSALKQGIKIISEENGIIKFSIDSNECFKGSALINGYNEIYGLVLDTSNGGIAISSDALEGILNENSIIYTTGTTVVPIDYTRLHSATDAASQIDTENTTYTEESLKNLDSKLKRAQEITKIDTATQGDVDVAADELEEAIHNLEEVEKKSPYGLIIGLIVGAFVLIGICVIAILCIKKPEMIYKLLGVKKKEPAKAVTPQTTYIDDNTIIDGLEDINSIPEKMSSETKTSAQPIQSSQPHKADFSDLKNFQGGYIYEDRQDAPINKQDGGLPNTSVLKNDIESNNEIVGVPYLIRVNTGERLLINRNQFTIGRDYNVDYRIPENISISKTHCRFMAVGQQWYIIDNNSSNKTLVNGVEIPPNESIPIYDKTEIILANEKLIFRFITETALESQTQQPSQNIVADTGILSSNMINPAPQQILQQTPMQAPQQNYASEEQMSRQNIQQEEYQPDYSEIEDDPGTNVLTANQIPEGMKVPYLLIRNKKIKMTQFPFSIGRGKKATYTYTNNNKVSREHIIITKEDGKYYIRDNKSSNGTLLNGEPMDPLDDYLLNNGDKITIVEDSIEFHL